MRTHHACLLLAAVAASGALSGCAVTEPMTDEATFAEDLAFLREHVGALVLGHEPDGARVVVVPAWQGRVVTSTPGGTDAPGMGWINRTLIASGQIQPHINVFGGEDRFWMGPEGGQFSIFFKARDPFDLEHWQTPPLIDTEPFELTSSDTRSASFRRRAALTNYSGTEFDVQIDRRISLLGAPDVERVLGVRPDPAVRWVAYQSENTLTNRGDRPWVKDTGLLSIWILGMFKHSPTTTVAIPLAASSTDVNDAYFGVVPADRLVIRDGVVYFKGDGQYRSKIGLPPGSATPVLGSYDPARGLLTIVHYTLPRGATDYVNSMWEIQQHPYAGDVVNSYNDGPPAPGSDPLGPFFELETSSPAAALAPGGSITHVHRTLHFVGSEQHLDAIARSVLGVDLATVGAVFR